MDKKSKTAVVVVGIILLFVAILIFVLRKNRLSTTVEYFKKQGDNRRLVRYGEDDKDVEFANKIKAGDKVTISGGSPYDGKYKVISPIIVEPPAKGGQFYIDVQFDKDPETTIPDWSGLVWLAYGKNIKITKNIF